MSSEEFPTKTEGLALEVASEEVELSDGEVFDIHIAPVAKRLGDATVRMLAYNGSIPGPTLRVPQGAEIVINVINGGDMSTTIHWHGVRLENRFDGTPHTQALIPVGGAFTYRVHCPDPGVYWYHPHIREDYGQEMGLYGNILVDPSDPAYWPPVHREMVLTLDDVLIENGKIAPFSRTETTYVAMGRFGNLLLVAGDAVPSFEFERGEVVRFYLTNTANTRVFNVALPDATMKLVGGDSGRFEREEFVASAIVAPSERVVVDAFFDKAGRQVLEHHTPKRTYPLSTIEVAGDRSPRQLRSPFDVLRVNPEWIAVRRRIAPHIDAPADKTLALVAEMDPGMHEGAVRFACPMHPDVVRDQPGHCPKCGMKLLSVEPGSTSANRHSHGHAHRQNDESDRAELPVESEGDAPHGETDLGTMSHGDVEQRDVPDIEWEDEMTDMNRMTTPANMRWNLVDRATGAVNHAIEWTFRVGDQVKIRLVNEMDSDHPMHHPFHIHGAGRFVVLTRNGITEPNLVWKDTVLVRTGETVDILLDVTNPGLWMAHCHIAEHQESGMMFSFTVTDGKPEWQNSSLDA